MRATERSTVENAASQPFVEGLQRISDPRQRHGQRDALETVLFVICAALVSGQQTLTAWASAPLG